ncbi:MAG: universal stress protein [Microlunatus sp.]|nr:universal stress protein [Microlunatus sp.]MDN5770949.1 universal stress protein [Microlunatus sp.]MDN5803924.1 universal stress protein [Microlunatus sp.]
MTILVGYSADGRGTEALHLASMLARSMGDEIVVCAVVSTPWPPSPERLDAEYRAYAVRSAEQAVAEALDRLPVELSAQCLVREARSVPAGLSETATEIGARLLVLGSSTSGLFGRVTLGSVTGRLLHGSPVSIVMAPRGYRSEPASRVTRLTAGFGGSQPPRVFLSTAASVAEDLGVALRIVTFAVRPTAAFLGSIEAGAEDLVVAQWLKTTYRALDDELERAVGASTLTRPVVTAVGHGYTWAQAIDDVAWGPGDVLAVGSSTNGPVANLFLGSHAAKILRYAPVPVVLLAPSVS